jgi:hypothetical protein
MITTDTYSTKSQRHHRLCARALTSQSSSAGIIINVGTAIVGNPWWLALGSTCRCSSHLRPMKPAFLLLFCWLLLGCVAPGPCTSDSRDYSITTCEATPQRIELVQERARNYLSRHPSSAGEVRLLAVIADSVFPSEVQDLWIKLGRSQTSLSAYIQRKGKSFKLWCVLLVDRSTQLPLRNQGYVLANLPARGEIVQIGGHRALYVGTGSF